MKTKKPVAHRELLAQVWCLLHYCEDFIVTVPKKNYSLPVLRKKCEQVKGALMSMESYEASNRGRDRTAG